MQDLDTQLKCIGSVSYAAVAHGATSARVGFERRSAAAEKYEAAYLTPLLRAGDRRALPDFSTDVHEECS